MFALSCGDGVAPERHGLGVPDFAVTGDVLTATFDAGADAFGYRDDPFRGTAAPAYASGTFNATGGFSGGGLQVLLGGIDDGSVLGMSGGWAATFTLSAPEDVTLTLRYQLTQSSEYESDEYSDALLSVDGMLWGVAGTDRLARLTGDGNGGTPQTTGWQQVSLAIPGLAAGTHTVVIGAYNNKKTASNETTELLIDDVAITTGGGVSIEQTPGTGDLTIATATTGENQPQGYTMSVTEPSGEVTTLAFATTESKTFVGVAPGDYRLEITDIPTNCGLTSGTNPRTVTVPDGGTGSTTFSVSCTSTTGNLKVKTSTTGSNLPAGYTLSVSGPGGSTSQAIGATDSVTFSAIPAGDYTVTLSNVATNCTVSGANPRTVPVAAGLTASTTFSVGCTAQNQPPVANFTFSCGSGLTCNFTSTSSDPDGSISAYSWTFGDGGTSTAQNPSHTYAQGGTYTVKLTVTDNEGVTGTTSKSVTVNQPPVANFTFSCGSGLTCNFTSTSSDPDGSISAYSWTFGDGGTSTAQNPSHTYAQGGTYTVKLTVTDNKGATGTTSKSVTVNQPPVATFTFSCNGLTCSFTSTSSDPDGSIAAYSWTFGDGGTSTAQNPSHTYAQGGTYTVKLTVTDNRGATASASKSVTVTAPNHTPSVDAGSDETVLVGVLYQFSASFSDPDCGPWNGTINWGDGTSTSGTKTSAGPISDTHTYLLPGSYTIRVTVTDSCGASGSDTKVLTVLTNLGGGLP
ncbi:MAG TPA: PKD domain-containing protein [Gemmatimonadales bacterium]|nr:PKD domain-containing protein [Gemmatimonadales bacterium]